MKIINNYGITQPNISQKKSVSFKSLPDNQTKEEVKSISNVTPDYNISTPMTYNFVGDIKLSEDLNAKLYKLANGQKVIIVPKDGTTVVKTYVNTGSLNEPDKVRGISHYIEHNLFNGSESLGDKVFFDEVNKMGANTNASTSFSVTDYYISSNLLDDKDLENKIKLQAGMIQSPKFLLEKLDKEKSIVDSEINMCLSDDNNVGYTKTLKNLFGIKSSSDDLVAGSTDNIDALTRDDVVNYFNNNYYPANMVTVVSGEVNPDDTMKLISKYFTSTKHPVQNRHYETLTPTNKAIREDLISKKTDSSSSIFLGFAGPENANSTDRILISALSVYLSALGNSKFSDIERKYSTSIDLDKERLGTRPTDKSALVFQTGVAEEYTEPILKDIYQIISDISKNPPTDEEMTAIKLRMKKSNQDMLESSHSINSKVGMAALNNNLDILNNYDKIVESMTPQDIVNTAKKYFNLNKAALTVVHPNTSTPEEINNNYNSATKNNPISFTGTNKKTPINVQKIKEYELPNNYRVILNDTNSDNVQYRFMLRQKDWTPKKAATADVLSEMLKNCGTKNNSLKDVLKKFDLYGINIDSSANDYGIYLAADFPTETAAKSLSLFNEMITKPDFSKEVFDKAIQNCRDNYSTVEPSPWDKFDKTVLKGLPEEFTIQDKKDSLKNITYNDVIDLYNEIFRNGQGQVTVSGDFTKYPELRQTIFNNTALYSKAQPRDISLEKTYSPIEKTVVLTVSHLKNQADIVEGFKFKQNGNIKDSVCLSLLNQILGGSPSSRLFSDLREQRHLAYSVSSNYDFIGDSGIMTLTIGTTTENHETGEKTFDNVKKSIDGFNENIKKITTEPVTTEELNAAKKAIKTSMLSALEKNSTKTSILELNAKTPYNVDLINQKLELIDKITPDDLLRAAKYVFSSKPVYSIAATQATLDANKDFLNSLG